MTRKTPIRPRVVSRRGTPRFIDHAGQRFGRLVVLGSAARRGSWANWRCQCDCGAQTEVLGYMLRRGSTTSCGCFRRDKRTTHGTTRHGVRTPEYVAWKGLRNRCNNSNEPQFPNYGGRGIVVCDRWGVFENFLADVGPRPSPNHSLDRIDVNGNYEPGNCRWATASQQARNTRVVVLCPLSAVLIRQCHSRGVTKRSLAHAFGVSPQVVSGITRGTSWTGAVGDLEASCAW